MSKKAGRHAQGANDFLMPYEPTITGVTDVGTSRAFNNGAVDVAFTADARNAATSFTATSNPGGYTASGSSSPLRVEGLQSNTSYTFTVTATNSYGTSAASAASSSVTATTVPATPAAPSATSGVGSYDSVSWTAPADGGKTITNYHWESNDSKAGDTSSTSVNVNQEDNTTQAYRVYATNANGNSDYSSYSGNVTTFTFAPFGFTPFGAFGFTPFGAFGFTPFGFTPFGFTPFGAFGFTPGGCFKYGTKIWMADGSWKNIEELVIGDSLKSLAIPGVPDSELPDYVPTWNTSSLDGMTMTDTVVANIKDATMQAYYKINENIEVTWEHVVLVKQDNVWSFKQVGDINIGDFILDENLNEVEITSKDEVFEEIQTITIDTEIKDVYFVKGMLAHNLLPSK